MAEIIVLGLDPGSRVTGWGVVREVSGVLSMVDAGTVRTSDKGEFAERLGRIFAGLSELMLRHKPTEVAIEDVFTAHNPASALKLGQARGAAIAACAHCGAGVYSYAPTAVKKSLVGVGRADKEQVAFMVGQLLGVRMTWPKDASDALAVAVCHLNERRMRRLTEAR